MHSWINGLTLRGLTLPTANVEESLSLVRTPRVNGGQAQLESRNVKISREARDVQEAGEKSLHSGMCDNVPDGCGVAGDHVGGDGASVSVLRCARVALMFNSYFIAFWPFSFLFF